MSSVSFSTLNLGYSSNLSFGNSFDSTKKQIPRHDFLPSAKCEVRKTNSINRFLKIAFLTLGLGTAACNPAKDVVIPETNLKGIEKEAAHIFKTTMVSATDRSIPLEARIHDNGSAFDTEYKYLETKGDTLIYKMRKISHEGFVRDGKYKFFKDKDGLFVAEDYLYKGNKIDDSRLALDDVNKFRFEKDGSVSSISCGVKNAIYRLVDNKTVLKTDLAANTRIFINSVFRKMK